MQSILKNRYYFYAISGILALISLFAMIFIPLNLGIDMTWGIQIEYSYEDEDTSIDTFANEAQVIKDHINFQSDVINSVNVYKITGQNSFIVEAGFKNIVDETQLESYKIGYKDQLTAEYKKMGASFSRYTNIGASFWDYIKQTAKLTLLIAIVGIAAYVAYAFSGAAGGISSLSFAAITIITLFHDVLISAGLYILTSLVFPQFQIDTFFVTALLTILGYSINDTIVIFDRIRTNLRQFAGTGKNLEDIISESLTQSMTRSVYTSMTIVFVLVCILVFGPVTLTGFTLTLLFGTIVGTFSSICIASPLLYEFHKNTILTKYVAQKDLSAEDKTVV